MTDLDISFGNKLVNLRTNLTKRTIHIWETSLMIGDGFPILDRVIVNWYANVLFACSIYTILDRLLRAGSDLLLYLSYPIHGCGSVLPCVGKEDVTLDVAESRIFALKNGTDGAERVCIAGK
jgi:hypothetical protein